MQSAEQQDSSSFEVVKESISSPELNLVEGAAIEDNLEKAKDQSRSEQYSF
jgi:hypothetical protein